MGKFSTSETDLLVKKTILLNFFKEEHDIADNDGTLLAIISLVEDSDSTFDLKLNQEVLDGMTKLLMVMSLQELMMAWLVTWVWKYELSISLWDRALRESPLHIEQDYPCINGARCSGGSGVAFPSWSSHDGSGGVS